MRIYNIKVGIGKLIFFFSVSKLAKPNKTFGHYHFLLSTMKRHRLGVSRTEGSHSGKCCDDVASKPEDL
jgi:hypothetical protein